MHIVPIESLRGSAVRDIRYLAVIQNSIIRLLFVLLLLGLNPILQLNVLLSEFIEETLV